MTLFATMANLLASIVQPTKPLYTTVVYPIQGKAVVLHDGLNIRSERTWYQYPESLTGEEEKSTYPFELHIDGNTVLVEPVIQTQADNCSLQSNFMRLMKDGWGKPGQRTADDGWLSRCHGQYLRHGLDERGFVVRSRWRVRRLNQRPPVAGARTLNHHEKLLCGSVQ